MGKKSVNVSKKQGQNQKIDDKLNGKITSLNHRNSIRIGLVGCVSSGKSTILNSICVNQYEIW